MKTLEVTGFAFYSYRNFVKGNEYIKKEEAEKKLTRNVILGKRISKDMDGKVWYAYGQMRMLVKDHEQIICVLNNRGVIKGWEPDYYKKEVLNKFFGIAQ